MKFPRLQLILIAALMATISIIVIAAAEVAIGLAIVIANYRNRRTVQIDTYDELKG